MAGGPAVHVQANARSPATEPAADIEFAANDQWLPFAHQQKQQKQQLRQRQGQGRAQEVAFAPYRPPAGAPPVKPLQTKRSWLSTLLFVFYMCSLIAYISIRVWDIVRLIKRGDGTTGYSKKEIAVMEKTGSKFPNQWYSLAILVVELIGASALVPYAFANTRHTLPVPEEPNEKRTWEQFGSRTEFDVFVIVPCYKESWKTLKRTLMCAMFARVPPGCRKHIIVGNDGWNVTNNPNCQSRSAKLEKLEADMRRVYPGRQEWFYKIWESQRTKKRTDASGKEIGGIAGNAKSFNLNHAIKRVIPRVMQHYHADRCRPVDEPTLHDVHPELLHKSVVVIFDVDMAVRNLPNESLNESGLRPPANGDGMGFFCKILRVLEDNNLDLVLSPQYFTNILPFADAFNHLNPQFWEYILPGLQPLGYVACTGTNMGLRLSMLHRHSPVTGVLASEGAVGGFAKGQSDESARYENAMHGPFPTYSVTEDYALSLELRKAQVKGTYIAEYLVKGEAPDGIVAVDIQRGRWTEGHWQIFFSLRNPIFSPFKLGFWGTIYYNYGTWAYLCNIITLWVYAFVPLLATFGIGPVFFSEPFRYAVVVFMLSSMAVQYYCREAPHFFGMWRANMSNVLLAWTYTKAIVRAALRFKAEFATHTEDLSVEEDELEPNPPMDEPQSRNLVSEHVKDIGGQLVFFTLLALVSLTTIGACIVKLTQVPAGKEHSIFVLPAAWAVYNLVGPLLFFCASMCKKTRSLEMCIYILSAVHTISGLVALVTVIFVQSSISIGQVPEDSPSPSPSPAPVSP